jgi:hypothetical protein
MERLLGCLIFLAILSRDEASLDRIWNFVAQKSVFRPYQRGTGRGGSSLEVGIISKRDALSGSRTWEQRIDQESVKAIL